MLLRTAIKLHTLSLVLLKEKWRGQGKRDTFCGLYHNTSHQFLATTLPVPTGR